MKLRKLTVIMLLIVIFMVGNVYAAPSCNISVETSKENYTKNEEFTVDVKIGNIQSDRGIISLSATLEYDQDSLELLKMEGKNTWETPVENVSYNKDNGKLVINRNGGLGKQDETVFTLTFKVKEQSKQNLIITLKNITVADGTAPAKIALAYKNITVTEGTTNPIPEPGPDTPDDNNNNNNNGNNNENNNNNNKDENNENNNNNNNSNINNSKANNNLNTLQSGTLPKAGDNSIIPILLTVAGIAIVVFFIKIRSTNKQMRHGK